jgi:hypothetical protein
MAVSNPCSMMDFDKLREQWRRAFQPVSSRELETWSKDIKQELRSIPYLRIAKESSGGLLTMLEIKTILNVDGLNFSMVKGDLSRVWNGGIAAGMKIGYTFRETESGIKFYFAALNTSNNYVTGVVSVLRKDAV